MLTQNDLRQIELIVDRVVDKKLEEKLMPIRRDISGMQKETREIKKEIREIKIEIKQMRQSINILADHFDEDSRRTKTRFERIEAHLKLPS